MPSNSQFKISRGKSYYGDIHGITVHGLAHENIVVVPVGDDLLHSAGGLGLPCLLSSLRIISLGEASSGVLVELLKVSCIEEQKLVICVDQVKTKGQAYT